MFGNAQGRRAVFLLRTKSSGVVVLGKIEGLFEAKDYTRRDGRDTRNACI